MKEKECTVIGGADGPTSIFIAGKGKNKSPLHMRKRSIMQWTNPDNYQIFQSSRSV